ncbi:MAG: peptidylprolyl isomerase, partial [Longimicrobiales bacterium]
DFAALAREHSQDGTAQQGGDLGFFGKDSLMAPPFKDAALALQPGQISDVVATVFGLHLIKVDERKNPSFEEMKDAFRAQTVQQRMMKAEEDYIKGLTDPLEIEVQEGAAQNAKEMANRPATSLRGRAASRALVRYSGGSLSAAELLSEMRRWDPGIRGQMATAPDDQIKQVLEQMARNEILVEEAEREGLQMSEAELDTARLQVQQQLATAARMVGLSAIQPQDGETMHQAIERKVNAYLDAIMKNEAQVIPLSVIGFSLREQFGGEVFDRAVDSVVVKIAQTRPPAPPAMPPQQPPMPPDTGTGR